MNITIITDASWCPDTKVGGYGIWIACNRGRLPAKGRFKHRVLSPLDAEMMAVVNGLHVGIANQLVHIGDKILFQTDCTGAIDHFESPVADISNKRFIIVQTFKDLVKQFNLIVEFKHVKGHSNGATPRLRANIACDQQAKLEMKKARAKHRIDKLRLNYGKK